MVYEALHSHPFMRCIFTYRYSSALHLQFRCTYRCRPSYTQGRWIAQLFYTHARPCNYLYIYTSMYRYAPIYVRTYMSLYTRQDWVHAYIPTDAVCQVRYVPEIFFLRRPDEYLAKRSWNDAAPSGAACISSLLFLSLYRYVQVYIDVQICFIDNRSSKWSRMERRTFWNCISRS